MAELNTTLITLLPLMTTDDEGSAVPFSGFPSKLENDGAGRRKPPEGGDDASPRHSRHPSYHSHRL